MPRARHYQNPRTPGVCLFATSSVLDFVPVFGQPEFARTAIQAIVNVHKTRRARLHAFVIMPEHVHLLCTLPEAMSSSAFVGVIKAKIAQAIVPRLDPLIRSRFDMQIGLNRRTFWQRSFRGYEVEGLDIFNQKAAYIHLNPVRRGLAATPEAFPWSSAKLILAGKWDEAHGLDFTLEDLDA